MASDLARIQDFLVGMGMAASCLDADSVLAELTAEMDKGLAADQCELAMIPTFVSSESRIPADKPVLVVDAGGTNLRVCTVTFDVHGHPTIDNFSKQAMPGLDREVSKDEFFETLADYLSSVADLSDRIGFCFSYPSEISPERDGKLLRWTKEVQIPELVGEYVGRGLAEKLEARGHGRKQVVVLNDTVAALLAGKSVGDDRECSAYVGYILGTGTNIAYEEKNANITKRTDLDMGGAQIINCESGNFSGGPLTEVDRELDAATSTPGGQLLEKRVSGAYLGDIGLALLKQAGEQGLVSQAIADAVAEWGELTTIEMDSFLWNPYGCLGPIASLSLTDAEREVLYAIFSSVVTRAALLAAVNVAAPVLKTRCGTSALHPVCINIDGSTFYKTHKLSHETYKFLDAILGARGVHYMAVSVDNAPVIGAAIAGLS
ncbi:MAG: hexokinase [Kiritimatiellae bacterium]|nr:hexokinase [Kiritimatiellia bacterium]